MTIIYQLLQGFGVSTFPAIMATRGLHESPEPKNVRILLVTLTWEGQQPNLDLHVINDKPHTGMFMVLSNWF